MSSIAPTILLGTVIGLDDATFMLALVPVLLLTCSIALGLPVVLRNVTPPAPPEVAMHLLIRSSPCRGQRSYFGGVFICSFLISWGFSAES